MHVAIVTAGGAGMYCGSCMQDNTLAGALLRNGTQVTLIPTYTPLKLDEENHAISPVYLGGLNLYLDYRYAWWRKIPRALTRWLDSPWIIDLATRSSVSNNAADLGQLTVALLQGINGPQRRHVQEFVSFLTTDLRPDLIVFSNALISGVLPHLRSQFNGPILCTLQGDDIFLNALIEPYKTQALSLLRENAKLFDGFLIHSAYYRDVMAEMLQIPLDRFHLVPLSLDFTGHTGQPKQGNNTDVTIGYFARICPEKGLHVLLDAFKILHQKHPRTKLKVAGYLGARDAKFFDLIKRSATPLGDAFEYLGSPDHKGKVEFLSSLDILSVPTTYREPKGIFVLEAWANGVPVVQPDHGAFPELLAGVNGGLLVPPEDPQALAEALETLVTNPNQRHHLATIAHQQVRQTHAPESAARHSVQIFEKSIALK